MLLHLIGYAVLVPHIQVSRTRAHMKIKQGKGTFQLYCDYHNRRSLAHSRSLCGAWARECSGGVAQDFLIAYGC